MKKLATLLIFIFCGSVQIWAQKNTPDEKSIVKKEYDENGNLIQYDSTYVWSWNSDSTLNFSFDDNFEFGKEFPDIFGDFNSDSIFEKFGFSNKERFLPFENDDFFGQFQSSIPDSLFVNGFQFESDSVFNFHFDNQFPDNFSFPEFEEIQKQLQENFNLHNFVFPDFNSPEQEDEWDELMKKHQKEKEELMKKWGEK